jgi:hypothetical protein
VITELRLKLLGINPTTFASLLPLVAAQAMASLPVWRWFLRGP